MPETRARAGKVLREHADEYPPYRYELGLLHLQEQQWAEAATSLRHGFVDNPYIAEILCGNPGPMPLRIRVHAERQIEAPHPPSGVRPGLRRELRAPAPAVRRAAIPKPAAGPERSGLHRHQVKTTRRFAVGTPVTKIRTCV